MNFKLGFGPMSLLINDTLAHYAKDKARPLMFIASRNQVDADSGYVMTTKELAEQLNPLRSEYLMLCRDHCGPYFLDVEKSLNQRAAIEATKRTIAGDIENGFDLIHIDTSRCEDAYQVADELFNFCLNLNPNIKFEFGTEENVGVAAGVKKYQQDVKFASQFPNMQFIVAQTGSLTMEDRQVGSFDVPMVRRLVGYANDAGVKLKEHNADYLTAQQIKLRPQAGVHACNIAPQLGVIQTKTIIDLARQYDVESGTFESTVLASGKWLKWIVDPNDDDLALKVAVAGHYCYNTDAYRHLEDKLTFHCDVEKEVKKAITACLDLYYENLYDNLV
jgi:hypothetical protein